MSGTQLRSGKNLSGLKSSEKRENKQPKGRKKTMCDDESAMSAEVMQEFPTIVDIKDFLTTSFLQNTM